MTDEVRPLDPMERSDLDFLGTSSGFGTSMLGLTRRNADGLQFGTVWVVGLGLPVRPKRRLYFRVGGTSHETHGNRITSRTAYSVVGATALSPVEVLKTYLYRWLLCPAIVAGPLVLFFMNVDALAAKGPILVVIAFPFVWGFGVLGLITWLHQRWVTDLPS